MTFKKSIQATKLGIKLCDILEKFSPQILDEELTRHFEEEMEFIRNSKKNQSGYGWVSFKSKRFTNG